MPAPVIKAASVIAVCIVAACCGCGAPIAETADPSPDTEKDVPMHIVLLGDSIFDNGVYVGDDPSVIEQLDAALPEGSVATLLAVDGDTTVDVAAQLKHVPDDATHLIVSVGGNDALQSSYILAEEASSVGEAVLKLAELQDDFRKTYEKMLDGVLDRELPTTVLTIYDPNFGEGTQQRMSVTALALFNDVITRAAIKRKLNVIDLRTLFDNQADYANPIEPSAKGGEKLVEAIQRSVNTDRGRADIAVFGITYAQ
ncbi:SGNH/GDSL hydrolase family protein [Stratiformator vulcanicus]|nr:SGNH/GDSL hydrolase family protein [Stratiformator vulcanicus]